MPSVDRENVIIPNSESWRVFCAIDLTREVRQRVVQHATHLRSLVKEASASWTRPENIHLTLKFLGDIPHASLSNLSDAASRAVSDSKSFTVTLEQTGVFPPRGLPRVLWLGINDRKGKLSELHARLDAESEKAGFAKETRPFHPHLTVARLRHPENARTLASVHLQTQFEPVEIEVSELSVIRSELNSAGSKYTVISSHRLR